MTSDPTSALRAAPLAQSSSGVPSMPIASR